MRQRTKVAATMVGMTMLVAACGSERAAVSVVPPAADAAASATATTVAGSPATTAADGSSSPDAAPTVARLLAAATGKTTAAKTVSMAIGIGLDARGVPGGPSTPIDIKGQGSFDYDTKQGDLHMDLTGIGSGADALTALDIVITGDTAYMKLPDSLVASTGGKHWTKLEGSAGSGLSLDLGQVKEFSDPTQFLKFLEAVSDSGITKVGTDVLHGEPATHYQVQIDPKKLTPSGSGSSASAGLGGDLSGMAEMLGSALPADVWIDAEGRVRQFEMTIDLTQFMKALIEGMSGLGTSSSEPSSAPASSLPADFHLAYTTRLEMWDFGKPVTITVPDPSDVAVGVSLPGIGGTTGDSFPEITLDTTDTATSDSPATTTADTMVPTDATPVGYPADTTTTVG